MPSSPLAISNIVLSQSERDVVSTPKVSFYRDALQPNPVPVLLRVRRLRVVAWALALAAVVAGGTFVLSQGVTLKTLHSSHTHAQREALVQDYNAYVAMVAALAVRPLQLLAALVLPVWTWCFLTETAMTQATTRGTTLTKVVVYALSIALVWLLSSSTHGLNVQFLESQPHDRISTSTGTSLLDVNATQLLNDSILRSAVTMDYRSVRSACARPSPQRISAKIEYGFASRPWMSEITTDESSTSQVQTSLGGDAPTTTTIPMEPAAARGLATYAFPLMNQFFLSSAERAATAATAKTMLKVSESDNSLWSDINTTFRAFTATSSAPRIQWFDVAKTNVTIAATNLSNGFVFERVTLEIPFLPMYMQRRLTLLNNRTSSVSYTNSETHDGGSVDYFFDINVKEECGEHACIVSPRSEQATDAPVDNGAQMRALPICIDGNGKDDVNATLRWNASACVNVSSHSFLVFSFAQRVDGEALNQTSDNVVRLKNARKVYSVTIGHLRWPAAADVSLRVKEETEVTISRDALPLKDLQSVSADANSWMTLVATSAQEIDEGARLKSDLILPSLFASTMPLTVSPTQCEVERGNLLASIEKQHWYALHSDQYASTAALFWLFQDGVLDEASSSSSSTTPSATSSTSSSSIAGRLVMQVPTLSAQLAYVGCAIVLLLSVSVLLFSKRHESRIEKHFTPSHLAQLQVDASSPLVPSSHLLHSDILNLGGDLLGSSAELRDFDVVSLTLRHRQSPTIIIQVPRPPSLVASASSSTSSFLAQV